MEAIRILKTVTDDRIEELNQFKGKKVEIIILPEISENKEKNNDSIFYFLILWNVSFYDAFAIFL